MENFIFCAMTVTSGSLYYFQKEAEKINPLMHHNPNWLNTR